MPKGRVTPLELARQHLQPGEKTDARHNRSDSEVSVGVSENVGIGSSTVL